MKIDNPLLKLPSRNYVYSSLGISFLIMILVFVLKDLLPPQVPLYYGKPVGEDQLVPTLGLLIAPGVSLGIIIINIALSRIVSDVFFKKALIMSSFFVSLLTAITILKIIFLVGFF